MKTYSRKNSSYIKKAFVASNFNEMCRLCLSEVDLVLTPIFQDYKISYKEWIQYSVDVLIEEGDGLPSNICEECLAMVEQTYLFKRKCKASDSKLREHLELQEHNDEGKFNEIGLIDVSEDHKNLFEKKEPTESKCDESSAVDTGGTNNEEEKTVGQPEDEEKRASNDTDAKSPDVQTTSLESEPQEKVIINKVKRYILRGEKREDDQEEDLTVCEVVPLDVRNEDSIPPSESENLTFTNLDCANQNGHLILSEMSNDETPQEKSGARIQEIYQLWGNEEEAGEGERQVQKSEEIMYLDVSWEDETDKGVKKQNVGMLEVDVEQNGVVQLHRIYTNKNQIEIIETMPETKSFKCFACSEHLPTYPELKEHLVKVHKDSSDVSYCEICCKSFTCANSLKRHMAVHTGFKPYKCKICERRFSQGSILKRHVLTHESLKPFNCHICNKSYTQKMNLLSHLKNHGFRTGTESYKCKLCSKSFVHQSGLSRHLKLHKGVRFLCVHCKKSFGDASALARHIKTLHQQQT